MALTSQISTSLLQVDGRMTEGGVIEIVPGARLLLDVGVEDIEPGALLDEIATAVAQAQSARDEAVQIAVGDLSATFVSTSANQTLTGKKTFGPDSKLEFNGAGFTPNYDTDLWIASKPRVNPTLNSQGLYIQHRVQGNLAGLVHDAGASELRLTGVTNTGAGQSAHEDSLVVTGGVNDINLLTSSLANFHTTGSPTGVVDDLALFRATQAPPLPAGFAVTQVASLYLENQIIGATNYTIWAGNGDSVLGPLRPKDTASVALGVKGLASQTGALFQVRNSADLVHFEVSAAGLARLGPVFGDAVDTTFSINQSGKNTPAIRVKAGGSQTADLIQILKSDNAKIAGVDAAGNIRAYGTAVQIRNAADSGTVVSMTATGFRWNDASLAQTTVGAAGAASALPATPAKYLRVQDSAGATFVIPAYAAS